MSTPTDDTKGQQESTPTPVLSTSPTEQPKKADQSVAPVTVSQATEARQNGSNPTQPEKTDQPAEAVVSKAATQPSTTDQPKADQSVAPVTVSQATEAKQNDSSTTAVTDGVTDEELNKLAEVFNLYTFGIAPDLDRLSAQARMFEEYLLNNILRVVNAQDVKKVIDVGCGNGKLTQAWGKMLPRAKVIGLDSSKQSIEEAEKLRDNSPDYIDNVEFLQWNMADGFPEEAKDADVIFISISLLYMRGIQQKILNEAFQILKPGGKVWIRELQETQANKTIIHKDYDAYLDVAMLAFEKMGFNVNFAADLPAMLTKAGFVNIRIEKENYPVNNSTMSGRIAIGVITGGIFNFAATVAKFGNKTEAYVKGLLKNILTDAATLRGNWMIPNFIAEKPL